MTDTQTFLSVLERAFIRPIGKESMTDTQTFQIWQGSVNVYKGVDVAGIVGAGVTIETAEFVTESDGLVAGVADINGRRAWAGFDAVEPGMYPVRCNLTLSDGQEPVLLFYVHVVALPL